VISLASSTCDSLHRRESKCSTELEGVEVGALAEKGLEVQVCGAWMSSSYVDAGPQNNIQSGGARRSWLTKDAYMMER
jgi:hypothetical protein